MVSNYLNFDFEDEKEAIGGVISSALRTLDRPRGALHAGLKLQNPLEGFKNPEKFQGRDILGINKIENESLRNFTGMAADIVLDPLNLAGALPISVLRKAGLAGKMVLPLNEKAGAISRVMQNYAMSAGARGAAEGSTALLNETNLPDYIKTPLEIASGFVGGALAGGAAGGGFKSPSKMRMTEEQINDSSIPSYHQYIDTVSMNDGFQIIDPKTGEAIYSAKNLEDAHKEARKFFMKPGMVDAWFPGVSYNNANLPEDEFRKLTNTPYATREEALAAAKKIDSIYGSAVYGGPKAGIDYNLKKVSALQDLIAANTLPDMDVPIGGSDAEPLIARKVKLIPTSSAPIDEELDALHEELTRGFSYNQNSQPEAYRAKSNWIADTGNPDDAGSAGFVVRQAFKGEDYYEIEGFNTNQQTTFKTLEEANKAAEQFKTEWSNVTSIKVVPKSSAENFEKIAKPLYSEGENVRQKFNSLNTPFSHNGMTFMYRGEKDYKRNIPVNEESLVAESWTTDPQVAKNFGRKSTIINPLTGQRENEDFILGKWIPNDQIVGAFGHSSGEHEYIVLNKELISDARWKELTGVEKNVPYGTTVYRVYNPEDGVTASYADSLEDARKLAKEVETSAEPVGYFGVLTENSGSKTYEWLDKPPTYHAEDWELTPVYSTKVSGSVFGIVDELPRARTYVPASKIEKLPNGMFQTRLDGGMYVTEPNMDAFEGHLNNYGATTINPEDFKNRLVLEAPKKTTQLLIEPVQRGHKPEINIANVSLDDKPVYYISHKSNNAGAFPNQNFSSMVEARIWGEQNVSDFAKNFQILEDVAGNPSGFKDKFLGMFTNPTIAGAVEGGDNLGSANKQFDQLVPIDKTPPPGDNLLDVVSGNNSTDIVPVAGTLRNPNSMTDAQVTASKLNVDESSIETLNKIIETGQPEKIGEVIYGPAVGAKITGTDPDILANTDDLGTAARVSAEKFYLDKMGINQPNEELINLFAEGFQKAGKTDQTTIGHINAVLRGLWATGDGSWLGIQGLLTIPRLIATGRIKDAYDVMVIPQLVLGGNKKAFGNYLQRVMKDLPEGAPSLLEAQKAGLHLSILQGNPDFDMKIMERITGGLINPDMAFTAAGDIGRISMFYNEWRRFGVGANLEPLARAINRATGIAEHPFGGQIGAFALFAPRFFQSQLEIIGKAITDGTIEGALARRQLLTLIGTGVSLTLAANYTRGYTDTDVFDPTSSNFMRIRNVAGQDVSVFGPWDSMVKLAMHLGSGDLAYARTKASPIISVATNIIIGKTFMGEDYNNPSTVAKSLLLPFAWQNVGTETPVGSALAFFGVKSSIQSPGEVLEANMQNLGLDPDDPLARREYLAEHPQQKKFYTDEDKKAFEVTRDIKARSYMNDLKTMNNELTLAQFRDNRTILQREQRNKLEVILKDSDFQADTEKRKWIQTYFDLYDNARDPITNDVNGPKLDQLQSKWIKDNGPQAFEYLQNYLLVGKNPVELKYLNDMNKLRDSGYFDMKKYIPSVYSSGLDDDQIEAYRNKVSAARALNPNTLGKLPFNQAMKYVLGTQLTGNQIFALDLAGKDIAVSPQVKAIKAAHPELFIWFNPNANWSQKMALEQKTPTIPTINQVNNQQPVRTGT